MKLFIDEHAWWIFWAKCISFGKLIIHTDLCYISMKLKLETNVAGEDLVVKPDLRSAWGNKVLVGDGAMGTYLYQKGFPVGISYEELNLTSPG